MPAMDAYGVMEKLKESVSPPKVAMVTMFENAKLVREFFDLGASGRLSKSASLKELVSAVHTAHGTSADQITITTSRPSESRTTRAAIRTAGRRANSTSRTPSAMSPSPPPSISLSTRPSAKRARSGGISASGRRWSISTWRSALSGMLGSIAVPVLYREKPRRPVIEAPGENHPHDTRPIRSGRAREKRVHGGAVPILLRAREWRMRPRSTRRW